LVIIVKSVVTLGHATSLDEKGKLFLRHDGTGTG